MGASLDVRKVHSTSREEVRKIYEKIWEEAREYYGNNPYSGSLATLQKEIDFKYITFDSREKAEDYIAEHQEKWGNAMAVIVKEGNAEPYTLVGGWCAS